MGPRYATLDEMRQSPNLSPQLRGVFDDIYHTGVVPPEFIRDVDDQAILGALSAWQQQATIFHRIMREQMGDPQDDRPTEWDGESCDHPRQIGNQKHLWGVITQYWSEQGGDAYSPGYRYQPMLLTVGCDRTFGDWMFGVAGEYSHGTVKCDSESMVHTGIDAFSLGLYGGRFGQTFYGKGVMQFGTGWNKERAYYASDGEWDHAAYQSAVLGSGLEFGVRWRLDRTATPWELAPHVGTDYYFLTSAGFEEHGGWLAHGRSSCDQNVVEIPFGLRLSKVFPMAAGPKGLSSLKPAIDVAYVRSAADNVPTVAIHETAIPDVVWNAYGNTMGRDIFRLTAGVTGQIGPNFTLGANYALESRANFVSQQMNLCATYSR
ncbi:MAG: autotransporter outer membrane beta-barrel domain-containing protein [Planctomycetaceae bacterium]|nr:autotransporter outer membrane beta-barrel domain-containing protein [Planctomycetaceae bacterium]